MSAVHGGARSASAMEFRSKGPLVAGVQDLGAGLARWRLWTSLAWEDLQQRYRRTLLGLVWVTLSFAAFILVKAVIFGRFADDPDFSFAIHLTAGYLAWQFIAGVSTDGCSVFISSANWIRGLRMPLSVFVFQSVSRNAVVAVYCLAVLVAVLAWERKPFSPAMLLAAPAFAAFLVNGVWVQLLLGTLTARHRDLMPLVQTVMRIMFFLTPIIWVPSAMGRLGAYVDWNPLLHYVEIFRQPFQEGRVDLFHWGVVGAITAGGYVVAFFVFALYRRRIIYWA